ncbi:SDR family NAD(P)-dependent oxidoreductase [Andreprevotia chitinilytica]|uniref:SDR family NAD(P)-dependent oxidoreductase n=1 Tax=Andreprevotia chitinilytica TaxID=396808 RepID=UPI00055071F8|nr:SDR family oxidoreductase [Andreprevotia chitinilytica]
MIESPQSESPRVVAITGTRKGIGKALAEHFLAKGHTVFGCSRGDASIANANYQHVCADVADETHIKQFFKTVRQSAGHLDILINNAASASMNHLLLTPRQTFSSLLETNVVGTFLCCREAAKLLKKSKTGGRIVNFSSIAVPMRLEGASAYAASKAAVVNLTEIMSKELAAYDITVNAIGPTPVPSSMSRTVPSDTMKQLIERQTIKRMGHMDDVLHLVDFLVSPKSSFITGQTIYLGGALQ